MSNDRVQELLAKAKPINQSESSVEENSNTEEQEREKRLQALLSKAKPVSQQEDIVTQDAINKPQGMYGAMARSADPMGLSQPSVKVPEKPKERGLIHPMLEPAVAISKIATYGKAQSELANAVNEFLSSKTTNAPDRRLAAMARGAAPFKQIDMPDVAITEDDEEYKARSEKALEKVFKSAENMRNVVTPEGLMKMQEIIASIPEDASTTEKVATFVKGAATNPSVIRDMIGTSVASSPEGLAIGIVGTAAGSLMGFPMLGGILASMASTYASEDKLAALQILEQEGVDINNPESLIELAQDDARIKDILRKKHARVATMSLVEGILAAASFGVSKYAKGAVGKAVGATIEVGGEGIGEASGIAASGGEMDAIEITAEVVAGSGMQAPQLMNIFAQKEIDKVADVAKEITATDNNLEALDKFNNVPLSDLNQKNATELQTEGEQQSELNKIALVRSQPEKYGFHGGTLGGKSDNLTIGYEGDQPFTGHYFFSDEERASSRGDRSQEGSNEMRAVDFSQYNLLKPSTSEYWVIKNGLKNLYNSLVKDNNLEQKDYLSGVNYALKRINDFSPSLNGKLNPENLKEWFAEWKILKDKNFSTRDFEQSKTERFETFLLKKLGYEGIDVRGLKEEQGDASPDTSSEGSVIFDLKPETVVDLTYRPVNSINDTLVDQIISLTSPLEARMSAKETININELNDVNTKLEATLDNILSNEKISEEQKDLFFEIIQEELNKINNYELVTETQTRKVAEITTRRIPKTTTLQTQKIEDVGLSESARYEYSDNSGGGASNASIKIIEGPDGKKKAVLEASSVDDKGKKKAIGKIILGNVEDLDNGTVNSDMSGNPVSVTIPLSGGRQVTIKDKTFAETLFNKQAIKEDYDPEFFEEEYIKFVGTEEVEVKLPIDQRKSFTKEEMASRGVDVMRNTPTTEEIEAASKRESPVEATKPVALNEQESDVDVDSAETDTEVEEEILDDEDYDPKKVYKNKKLSPQQNADINELNRITDGGKNAKVISKNRNKDTSKRSRRGIGAQIKDSFGEFGAVLKRISKYNEEVGSILRRNIFEPLVNTITALHQEMDALSDIRVYMQKHNITEKERSMVGVYAAAMQYDANDISIGIEKLEQAINNSLKVNKQGLAANTFGAIFSYNSEEKKHLYNSAQKDLQTLQEIKQKLESDPEASILTEKEQGLYDVTKKFYADRFDNFISAIARNHGDKAALKVISESRGEYFHVKALGGYNVKPDKLDVEGGTKKPKIVSSIIGSAKSKKDAKFAFYELDIMKNLEDYVKDYYVETSLHPTISNIKQFVEDPKLGKIIGPDNTNSIIDSLDAFNRQKRGLINQINLFKILDKARANYITVTLTDIDQIGKQTLSGFAAASMILGVNNPTAAFKTMKYTMPLAKVKDVDGSEIFIDDWMEKYANPLFTRGHSMAHNYQIEKQPGKVVMAGSLEDKLSTLSEATNSGMIRRPDYIAARTVFIADYLRRGGKFESPNQDLITSALATQSAVQGANDISLGGRIYINKSEGLRFTAKAFLTFMGFPLAQLVTLANAGPHVIASGAARREAGAALGSMIGFAYAAVIMRSIKDELWDFVFDEDEKPMGEDEGDDNSLFTDQYITDENFHKFVIAKGFLDGTAGTVPILGDATAHVVNNMKIFRGEDIEEEKDNMMSLSDLLNTKDGVVDPKLYKIMYEQHNYGIAEYTSLLGVGYGEPINRMMNLAVIASRLLEDDSNISDELVDIYLLEMAKAANEIGLLQTIPGVKHLPFRGVINGLAKRNLKAMKREYLIDAQQEDPSITSFNKAVEYRSKE
jgi:hypothetical protein